MSTPGTLHQILYCSFVAPGAPTTALDDILAHARMRNASESVTGMLLTDGQLYVQWIEGPKESVMGLWSRIQGDLRHHLIVKLFSQDVTERSYENWPMAYSQASRAELVAIVEEARKSLVQSGYTPWQGAVDGLLRLLSSTGQDGSALSDRPDEMKGSA
jgi:Sensors of blue-light using FAD